ncbi:MAG: glucose-6-phosphate isomerase [Candidatus Saccharibacteria bacterium]|nr:glucose-6-phosphate isomerase [Candidatus Saccharibacteria bacterium]
MIEVNFSPKVDYERILDILAQIRGDKMAGWVDLARRYELSEIERIKRVAERIRNESECLVCIGIGGSYLGHRAIIEALKPQPDIKIIYAGNSLSRRELELALKEVEGKDFSINVISKSGTTLEPAIAFKEFKQKLINRYGLEGARERIYATTDASVGDLHDEAVTNNYERFVIPDDVGGRYSVLSAVGLLPMAVAGINIERILEGAKRISLTEPAESPAVKYAWMRYLLGEKGYDTEIFASFEPSTLYFNEWLKQLFGESEGKDKKGIFPAGLIYSTDLHSMGQLVQDGRRNLFETILDFPTDELNKKLVEAVKLAHIEGGIPVLSLKVPSFDEEGFGELIYFFELACAISAKLIGVNPFNQPGVEAYKRQLKRLLEK